MTWTTTARRRAEEIATGGQSEEDLSRKAGEALPRVLKECCQAEAEAMWELARERLQAPPEEKAVFIRDRTAALLKQVTPMQSRDLMAVLIVELKMTISIHGRL